MKTRNDFISNSSSCSFIVGLHTEQDVNEFKKLFSSLKDKNVSVEAYDTAEMADWHDNGYALDIDSLDRKDILFPGCYVLCDAGEDHDSWYEQRYDDMCAIFDDSRHKFKFYIDSWAHMTRGKKLPVE